MTGHSFKSLVLTGKRRRDAIASTVPLTQLVAKFAHDVPQERCADAPTAEIEVFRSATDDALIEKMTESTVSIAKLVVDAQPALQFASTMAGPFTTTTGMTSPAAT